MVQEFCIEKTELFSQRIVYYDTRGFTSAIKSVYIPYLQCTLNLLHVFHELNISLLAGDPAYLHRCSLDPYPHVLIGGRPNPLACDLIRRPSLPQLPV